MKSILDAFTKEKEIVDALNRIDNQTAHYRTRIDDLKAIDDPALKARSVSISVYEKMIEENEEVRAKLADDYNAVEEEIKTYFAQFK